MGAGLTLELSVLCLVTLEMLLAWGFHSTERPRRFWKKELVATLLSRAARLWSSPSFLPPSLSFIRKGKFFDSTEQFADVSGKGPWWWE